jgi:DNA mismatch repair protein MutS
MTETADNLTPMLRQYLEIKEQHRDAILFFRLGDFYEMFFEDAVKASEILDITLTSRNKNAESSVPLCGVPYHSASSYIRKLIGSGQKVAICEQVEDPKAAKGIVKREITRIVTPGLVIEDESLQDGEANYLAAAGFEGDGLWLAFLDISTGEVLLGFYDDFEPGLQQLHKHRVKELVADATGLPERFRQMLAQTLPDLLVSLPAGASAEAGVSATDPLRDPAFPEAFLRSLDPLTNAASRETLRRLLAYVRHTQRSVLHHLGPIQILQERQYLGMDGRTFRHLELLQNARGEGRSATLFWVLNRTQTAMGARKLRKWIHYPLLDLKLIGLRQDAVAELLETPERLFELQEGLKPVQDVERMLGKLALATVHGRDLYGLGQSLRRAQELIVRMAPLLKSEFFSTGLQDYPDLSDLTATLLAELREDAPTTIREGGIIADGIHPGLDELRSLSRDGKSTIARMEAAEKKRTGIASLKIRYNKVFGYYIEITHAHKDSIPADYIRKQTLTNAERFITPELKEYESKVLSADERIKSLEYALFVKLRELCAGRLQELRRAAEILGSLDAIASLARVARDHRYTRPRLTQEKVLVLKDSRHPVLEQLFTSERFIPNDLQMDAGTGRLFLITGPNMAGKSTVMRQAALIILMAQMGSFVPASEAVIGVVDQLFTRIGASDDISQGQSTFMVEMLETANILRNATERSFIVLDEIGRGTSTYDGMSIAWAVAEYVATTLRCRALFATHYHELTELAGAVEGIENYQVVVKEWNDRILFLRKLVKGGASRSYGIEVARLAGLPEALLARAREVLRQWEQVEGRALTGLHPEKENVPQLDLFAAPSNPAIEAIRALSLEALTPIEALNFLYKIKEKL